MDSHLIPLKDTFDAINLAYFDGLIDGVRIKWAPRRNPVGGKPRKIITFGMYYHDDLLITIHPVLGHEWVPHYVRAAIVFHEALHHWYPDTHYGLHTTEFKRMEARNPHFASSEAWIAQHMDSLLAAYCPAVLP